MQNEAMESRVHAHGSVVLSRMMSKPSKRRSPVFITKYGAGGASALNPQEGWTRQFPDQLSIEETL